MAAVTTKGHDFLQALLLRERRWWGHVVEDVQLVASVLRDSQLAQWSHNTGRETDFLPWLLSSPATANLLRRFRRSVVDSRSSLTESAARKAQAHAAAAQAGVAFDVLPEVHPFDPGCQCRICHTSFSTHAAAASHMAKRHGVHVDVGSQFPANLAGRAVFFPSSSTFDVSWPLTVAIRRFRFWPPLLQLVRKPSLLLEFLWHRL